MSVKVVCKSWKEKQPNWHPIIHRGLLGGNRNEGKKGENVCRNLSHGMERAWTISRGEIGKGSWEKEEAEITAKTGTEWTLLKSKGDEEKRKCGSAVRGQLAQWADPHEERKEDKEADWRTVLYIWGRELMLAWKEKKPARTCVGRFLKRKWKRLAMEDRWRWGTRMGQWGKGGGREGDGERERNWQRLTETERDRDKEGEGERTEKREQMLGRNVDSIAKGTDLGQVLVI